MRPTNPPDMPRLLTRCFATVFVLALLSVVPARADVPTPPPGLNVHFVLERDGHRMWRGAAPRPDTVRSLAASAKARKVVVTFFDLRHPANDDDKSGKSGKLTPAAEEAAAAAQGMVYVSISALDKTLVRRIDEALARGDVYLHCMYGVNRTGFAMGRFCTAEKVKVDRTGLGERDWNQGEAFQKASR